MTDDTADRDHRNRAPDHIIDTTKIFGPLSDYDVQDFGTHLSLRLDSVEYDLPDETARQWIRVFRDALDGRETGVKRAPDVEFLSDFHEEAGDVYVVSIGGHHSEYGEGTHLQDTFYDTETFADLVDDFEEMHAERTAGEGAEP